MALANGWYAQDPDPDTREELLTLIEHKNIIELGARFSGRLAFGTAGLRGELGAGPMRMNRLVVRQTSAGLGQYLLNTIKNAKERGVVIGYDGRHKSDVFAEDTAAVLCHLGIRVYVFDKMAATPLVAYALKNLGAAAAIVVTASHNPPEYNGYKVYWENGAQIIPPHDKSIAEAIADAAQGEIQLVDLKAAKAEGLCTRLTDTMLEAYLQAISDSCVRPMTQVRKDLRIAYTALHGVGARVAEMALKNAGFENFYSVASQHEPDGDFPTVNFPNPEEPGAMDAVLELAHEHDAHLAIANDPDADRLAVAVRTHDGDYQMLTGDQIGVLLGYERLIHGPSNAAVGTTIVSSRMLPEIARARGAFAYTTLTGFKWIANEGMKHEAQGKEFVFGYEEALGYTVGRTVRDKDGISAALGFSQMAAALHEEGKSVLDLLEELYRKYGFYLSAQRSLKLSDDQRGPSLPDLLRQSPPTHIAGIKVQAHQDILTGWEIDAEGKQTRLDLPQSDVVLYFLEDGSRVVVRPSGTEPKIKCYYEVRREIAEGEDFNAAKERTQKALDDLITAHQAELQTLRK
ncbi:phospho-sugar mutase [Myxococcota bacterium]|nr:phospho-sugar mutase [Myxococcota bacterium]